MRVDELKEYIIDNNYIETILEDLGCKSIRKHDGYFTAGNPDGDNTQAITVYDNESLITVNYTRNIAAGKRTTDIFDLVSFYKDYSFPEALKYVHDLLGIDYYSDNTSQSEARQLIRMIKDMEIEDGDEDDEPLKPISEKILSYYLPYCNTMFEQDGISLQTQEEFGIGYDPQTNRITIPIRTPLGDLCGVKGRIFGDADSCNPKYLYIEPTAKRKLLYGFYENKEYIKNNNYLFLFEAEKSVLQCASHDMRNCVALGGKSISKTQVELIVRTGCIPILALDKGVELNEIKKVMSVFPENISSYYIFDQDNIMFDKQSPVDNWNNWNILIKNNIYKNE